MPKDQQLAAAQAAVSLLPDENREALRMLLLFLQDVVACVGENQMTPTNLAVCLAPSLFHLNTLRRKESSSPRCVCVCACTACVHPVVIAAVWHSFAPAGLHNALYIGRKQEKVALKTQRGQDTERRGGEK